MKQILFIFICIMPLLTKAQTEITKTVVVDGPGWKRVARLDGAYGRGYNEVTLLTTGGLSTPRVAKISWFKGWSAYGGLNLSSVSDNGHWSDARITYDSTKAYLEINFTSAIPTLNVYLDQSAWVGGNILEGTLPDGSGTVLLTAKFGRLNYGENDLFLSYNGNVGIGTTTPDAKLAVNGNIHTKEVRVDLIGWADYVFDDNYILPTLQQVEDHITTKGHLINIPSAAEVAENGILLGEMNAKLLEKIEELTLYTIAQQKRIKELQEVKTKNTELETRLTKIEALLNKE